MRVMDHIHCPVSDPCSTRSTIPIVWPSGPSATKWSIHILHLGIEVADARPAHGRVWHGSKVERIGHEFGAVKA